MTASIETDAGAPYAKRLLIVSLRIDSPVFTQRHRIFLLAKTSAGGMDKRDPIATARIKLEAVGRYFAKIKPRTRIPKKRTRPITAYKRGELSPRAYCESAFELAYAIAARPTAAGASRKPAKLRRLTTTHTGSNGESSEITIVEISRGADSLEPAAFLINAICIQPYKSALAIFTNAKALAKTPNSIVETSLEKKRTITTPKAIWGK